MALSFVTPQGFRFFSIMSCIAILILAFVKSLLDILPPNDLVHFMLVNFLGTSIFIASVHYSKNITNSKLLWFLNSFILSGIILILYGSTVEIKGQMNEELMPLFYIVEISIILYMSNKITKEDDREQYMEMLSMRTTRS